MTGRIRDDFAGGGGWSVGLQSLDLEDIGVELEKYPVATARAAGFKRWHVSVTDAAVRSYDWGKIWGYLGSPPCQTFSPAGKGEGRKHLASIAAAARLVVQGRTPEDALALVQDEVLDERTMLVLEPLYVIAQHRPEWVALEQVAPVLPIWEAYAELMREMGYEVVTGVLNAEQYGVPQARQRAVLMARLDGPVQLPTPTHSEYHRREPERLDAGVLPWVSMAQALGEGWQPSAANPGTTDEQMSWVYTRPSPTIVGSFSPDVVAAPGYRKPGDGPRQNTPGSVRISLAEASILQSFPADYPWAGPKTAQWRQVGDAVPPLLAAAIVRELTAPTHTA